jgi:hypothetical protein
VLFAERDIGENEMNGPAVMQLRLPQSVKSAVARLAKLDGVSMNQMIATAVAEKIAVLEAATFFEERAKRADYAAFDRIMNRTGGELPREGDEQPTEFPRRG